MEPFSLAMVAASALPQVFGFIFDRLGVALDRRTQSQVDDPACPVLATPPSPLHLQPEQLTEERTRRMEGAARELAVYQRNPDLIQPEDDVLIRTLSQVRDDLEVVYGQRFTFIGEQRPKSGVRINQEMDEVEQDAVARALKARNVTDKAAVDIDQRAKVVRRGGTLTGLEVDGTLG
ncbi:hypothetical protein ACIP6X_36815 [Streptomyces coeruleorubidus]|uniref:hypothetical protein n=1 Tax=Streptomyces coeruleorubidus TaxID=116188 RepID=UPI0037F884DD